MYMYIPYKTIYWRGVYIGDLLNFSPILNPQTFKLMNNNKFIKNNN